jgi:hypothetical protein
MLCQAEYKFNFIVLMYLKHNGMSSTEIKNLLFGVLN